MESISYQLSLSNGVPVEELRKRFETEADIRLGRDCQKSRARFAPTLTSVLPLGYASAVRHVELTGTARSVNRPSQEARLRPKPKRAGVIALP